MLFVGEFQAFVSRGYRELVAGDEEPELRYESLPGLTGGSSLDEIAERLQGEFNTHSEEEQRRGATLIGPHRDDLSLLINGISVQRYASQGQHKTLLVALKIAEFHFLKDRRNEAPIFLLDDLFSELDQERSDHIVQLLGDMGQTIVTTTDEGVFGRSVKWTGQNKRFYIEEGTCREE